GGTARERHQGRSVAVQPHRSGRGGQRHAGVGHRDGGPGESGTQGRTTGSGPRGQTRGGFQRVEEGEGAGGRRVVVRGRGRLVGTVAPRRGRRRTRRGAVPTGVLSRGTRTPGRRRGRVGGDGQGARRRGAGDRDG